MTTANKTKAKEYRLIVRKFRNEDSGQSGIVLRLETVKEFSSFQYELKLRSRIEGMNLIIELHGLAASAAILPSAGPAFGELVFDGLSGIYELIIIHSNGERALCTLRTDPLLLTAPPDESFLFAALGVEQLLR